MLADGTQIGWGMACGAYPAKACPAIATLRVSANGSTRFAVVGHEMGRGIRSTLEQILLRYLDINPEKLELLIGDTSAAPQHLTAGSWGTASATPAAFEAAAKLNAAMSGRIGRDRQCHLSRDGQATSGDAISHRKPDLRMGGRHSSGWPMYS